MLWRRSEEAKKVLVGAATGRPDVGVRDVRAIGAVRVLSTRRHVCLLALGRREAAAGVWQETAGNVPPGGWHKAVGEIFRRRSHVYAQMVQ